MDAHSVDVQQRLDEIVAAVQEAKGLPMSASCVINRTDLLARLEEVRQALPGSLAQAQELLGGREQVVAEAQAEAERILEATHAERDMLIEGTAVAQQAQAEASRLLAEARREAAEVKVEADDYVDSKLANFEVVLGKTIGSVDRGREKLLGPGRGDPQQLLERADAYVDAQFAAIEAVLRKTLEAVGRGRQKLTGHRPSDELAEHVAAQQQAPLAGSEGYQEPATEEDTYAYLGVPPLSFQPDEAPAEPAYPLPSPGAFTAVQRASTEGYAQDGYLQETYAQDGYQQDGYQQDGYQQGGYPQADYQQGDYQDGYGYGTGEYAPVDSYTAAQQPDPYDPQSPPPAQPAYGYQQPQGTPGYQAPGALDETSLFDTGMLDPEQLRHYEQGHH